jgi:hypothetical protein
MKEAEIILTAERHDALVVAEAQVGMLKAFLEKKLNAWHAIDYNELKVVCDLLGIERRDDE